VGAGRDSGGDWVWGCSGCRLGTRLGGRTCGSERVGALAGVFVCRSGLRAVECASGELSGDGAGVGARLVPCTYWCGCGCGAMTERRRCRLRGQRDRGWG